MNFIKMMLITLCVENSFRFSSRFAVENPFKCK